MRCVEMAKRWLRPFYHDPVYPPFNEAIRFRPYRLRNSVLYVLAGFFPSLFRGFYDWRVTERIVEIPFVFRQLSIAEGGRVLDFGCHDSKLCMHMANMGFSVTGVDLLPYRFTHPNLLIRTGDFLSMDFEWGSFDAVVAVSAVEHVGLGGYGNRTQRSDGDRRAIERFFRILRPGGQLILTVPFGKARAARKYRVYDGSRLSMLLSAFDVDVQVFYRCKEGKYWVRDSAENVCSRDPLDEREMCGVALTSCHKGAPGNMAIGGSR